MDEYSNELLASEYGRMALYMPQEVRARHKRLISEAGENIPRWYRERGSLDELKVKGIGEQMKGMLEMILEKGIDQALKIENGTNEGSDTLQRKWYGVPSGNRRGSV